MDLMQVSKLLWAAWSLFLVAIGFLWTLIFFFSVAWSLIMTVWVLWIMIEIPLETALRKFFYRHFTHEEVLEELSYFAWRTEEELINLLISRTKLSWYKVGFYTKDVEAMLRNLEDFDHIESMECRRVVGKKVYIDPPLYRKLKRFRPKDKKREKVWEVFTPAFLPAY